MQIIFLFLYFIIWLLQLDVSYVFSLSGSPALVADDDDVATVEDDIAEVEV